MLSGKKTNKKIKFTIIVHKCIRLYKYIIIYSIYYLIWYSLYNYIYFLIANLLYIIQFGMFVSNSSRNGIGKYELPMSLFGLLVCQPFYKREFKQFRYYWTKSYLFISQFQMCITIFYLNSIILGPPSIPTCLRPFLRFVTSWREMLLSLGKSKTDDCGKTCSAA